MRVVRIVLALMVVAASTAVVLRVAIPRWQCGADKYERLQRARANVARCRECIARFPQDHQLHMLLASNLRILGERDEAIRTLQHAIALSERPDMWAQIGEMEIERGNLDAGRDALITAATFEIFFIDWVSEPVRSQVNNAVMARYERLRASATK